jgi:hypothetical protein
MSKSLLWVNHETCLHVVVSLGQNVNEIMWPHHEVMPRKDYRSLTIPEGLYLELENVVEQSNGSYVSISEVVREALRHYLSRALSSA